MCLCVCHNTILSSLNPTFYVHARWQELKSGSGTEYECLTALKILAFSDFLSYCNTTNKRWLVMILYQRTGKHVMYMQLYHELWVIRDRMFIIDINYLFNLC